MNNSRGLLIILSGPSGCGKDTLLKLLRLQNPNIQLSISATTRPKREYEEDGKDYQFVSRDDFENLLTRNEVLEYTKYCDHYYSTPKKPIYDWMNEGRDVVLEIEVDGAAQVRSKCTEAISIFIMPPSLEELEKRLRLRGSDSEESIAKRLSKANFEMRQAYHYDYVIVNDVIDEAVDNIRSIIRAEKSKKERMIDFIKEVTNYA